jgi:hypothetical protein
MPDHVLSQICPGVTKTGDFSEVQSAFRTLHEQYLPHRSSKFKRTEVPSCLLPSYLASIAELPCQALRLNAQAVEQHLIR